MPPDSPLSRFVRRVLSRFRFPLAMVREEIGLINPRRGWGENKRHSGKQADGSGRRSSRRWWRATCSARARTPWRRYWSLPTARWSATSRLRRFSREVAGANRDVAPEPPSRSRSSNCCKLAYHCVSGIKHGQQPLLIVQ